MTAITRLQFEGVLSDRRAAQLLMVGKSPAPTGANPAYDDAAREGLFTLGITPAAWSPADADFALVAPSDWGQLFDVAEYRLVRSAVAALTAPNTSVSMGRQELGTFRADLLREATMMLSQLQSQYSYGLGSAGSSVVSLQFEEESPANEFAGGSDDWAGD